MIKVTLNEESKQKEKPFPKLMTLKKWGGVFYFVDKKSCFCLKKDNIPDNAWSDGEYYGDGIDFPSFTDYNEPITLQNA